MNEIKAICIDERYESKYYLLSNHYPFKQYEYFKILDENNNYPICKVVKARSIFKLKDIDNQSILKNACSLGFKEDETFYWGEVVIDKELTLALTPNSNAIKTTEEETYDYLYDEDLEDKFILGEIRGTENVYEELKDDKYKDVLVMFKDKKVTNQNCLPLVLDYKKFQEYPNIGIFGNSGSGKTFTLKSIVEEILIKNLPAIVFDPHNEFDFSDIFPGIPDKFKHDFKDKVEYYTAGIDFGLQFLDLTNEELKMFIQNVSTLTDPQALAIDELREDTDSFESFKRRIETLASAMAIYENPKIRDGEMTPEERTLNDKYGKKITNSIVLKSLNTRLSSLERANYFTKGYDNIVNALKDRKVVIIRGEYNLVAPMMSIILNALWIKRKNFKDGIIEEEYPPLITILDEAHIYAPKDYNIKAPLRNCLISISREGRKYGMFLICATQRISELNVTILSQMSTRIILKTAQKSDKEIIQKECGLSDAENSNLQYLDSGHGYIISPMLKTKSAIAFKSRCNYSKPKSTINVFDELETLKKANTKMNLKEYILLQMPLKKGAYMPIISGYKAYSGEVIDMKKIKLALDELEKEGSIQLINNEYQTPNCEKIVIFEN